MNDLCDLTIADVSRVLRSRRASCAEVLDSCLRRIERDEPELNAFISVMAGAALEEAAKADRRLARGSIDGPLHGIPISLKDLYDVAGFKTTVARRSTPRTSLRRTPPWPSGCATRARSSPARPT